jgi:hypothetical protein
MAAPSVQAADERAHSPGALDRLARPVTATFLTVPLVAGFVGAGDPARLFTLSGAAALLLAADLLLERVGRPTLPSRSIAIGLIGWMAGLLLLGAAGQTEFGPYRGEAAAVVGVIAAAFVAAVCPRPTAVMWSLAAAGAVGLGASLVGPPNPGMAMAVSAIAVGAVAGFVLRANLDTPSEVPVSR